MFKFIFKVFIRLYQIFISPFLGKTCRFKVSCSNNMLLSLSRFGVVLGLYFGLLQIVYCNPWLDQQRGL